MSYFCHIEITNVNALHVLKACMDIFSVTISYYIVYGYH